MRVRVRVRVGWLMQSTVSVACHTCNMLSFVWCFVFVPKRQVGIWGGGEGEQNPRMPPLEPLLGVSF